MLADPGSAPQGIPRIPTGAPDAPQEVGGLDQLDAIELALGDLEPSVRVNGHQRDVVAAPCERRTQVEPAVVRPALAGGVVDDEQHLERARHLVSFLSIDLDGGTLAQAVARIE